MSARASTATSGKYAERAPSPEVLVLLSGGADSAACIAFFREIGRPIAALFVNYQQAAANHESTAAVSLANHYHIPLGAALVFT